MHWAADFKPDEALTISLPAARRLLSTVPFLNVNELLPPDLEGLPSHLSQVRRW